MTTARFANKPSAHALKRRGGYYTPPELAEYLATWAIRSDTSRVLEPSCGDGSFVLAALKRAPECNLVAIEIEEAEIRTAATRTQALHGRTASVEWLNEDFFLAYQQLANGQPFDVVIGNPPFIRFQYFGEESRDQAFHHLREIGYHPTKLANAWAAFVQLSVELLRPGGRLAMVVPAELLQVGYAAELRARLSSQFDHIVLVAFRRLVFPDIQQEVMLLLAEGRRSNRGGPASDIHTIEFEDGPALLATDHLGGRVAHIPARHSRKGMKWTSLFLDDELYAALDESERAPGIQPLGEIADVDVGVVTGRNSFFLLSSELKDQLGVNGLAVPVVGRTSALKGLTFTPADYKAYSRTSPSWLLNLRNVPRSRFSVGLLEYIRCGEEEGVHEGYKCRIRNRWYDVPSVYAPDAFLYRQIHQYPLLVANLANAVSTDTIHRVRLKHPISARELGALCFNSLTLAWAEVCGRSYGGGVLELEPREAEQLPVPSLNATEIDHQAIDGFLRIGDVHRALDQVDDVVLRQGLGLDRRTIARLRAAWQALRDRRVNRR